MAEPTAQAPKNFDWFVQNGTPVSGMTPPEKADEATMRAFFGSAAASDPNLLRQNYEYTYWRSPEGRQRASLQRQLDNPPPEPKRFFTNLIPTAAAMTAAALVPEAAPLAWLLRMGAAGTAAAGGEGGREAIMGEQLNPTKMAVVGATNAAATGVGEGLVAASPFVAKKLMTVGLPRTQAIARQFVKDEARRGNVISPDQVDFPQQFLDRGYTVGRINRNMAPGSAAITADMDALMAQRAALLDDATNAGVTYSASEMLKFIPTLRAQAQKQGQKALAALDAAVEDFTQTWTLPNGQWRRFTPNELEQQKELWANMGKSARNAKDKDDIANITSEFWGKAGQAARERLETLSTSPTGVTRFPQGPGQMAPVPMPGVAQPSVPPAQPPAPDIRQLVSQRAAQNLYAQNLAIVAEKHGMPLEDLSAIVNGEVSDVGGLARAFNIYGLKIEDINFLRQLRPPAPAAVAPQVPTPVIHPSQIQPPLTTVMPSMATTTPVGPFVTGTGQGIADLNRGWQQLLPLQQVALGSELPRAASSVIDRTGDLLIRPSVLTRLAKVLNTPATQQGVKYTVMGTPAAAQAMGMFDLVNDPYNMRINPY